jgi:hypothetical protein
MLDADLAALYGVETKALTRAVRRNPERFPADFMFSLSDTEFARLRRQTGTSSQWGGRRYPPLAFTEHGVADVGLPCGAASEKPAASRSGSGARRLFKSTSPSCAPSFS